MEEIEDFSGNFGVNFTNFDPNNLVTDEVIGITVVIDKSGSVYNYVDDMNDALNDFLHTMQKSHHSSKMMVQVVEYDDKVNVVNGYQPILDVKDFNVLPNGLTSLYDGVYVALKNSMEYKEKLEQQGISFKNLIFNISDGEDNNSSKTAADIKKFVENIYANESNYGDVSIIFFGVGNSATFNKIAADMGIKLVTTVGTTGAELRKMVSIISSSVSSTSSGGSVPTSVTF
jgi:uncharacterized protein YegL